MVSEEAGQIRTAVPLCIIPVGVLYRGPGFAGLSYAGLVSKERDARIPREDTGPATASGQESCLGSYPWTPPGAMRKMLEKSKAVPSLRGQQRARLCGWQKSDGLKQPLGDILLSSVWKGCELPLLDSPSGPINSDLSSRGAPQPTRTV